MTSRDFCFWLQGMFELGQPTALNEATTAAIRKHLALVFIHEIDPSMGPPEHQAKLNETHAPALTAEDIKAALEEGIKKHEKVKPHHFTPGRNDLVMRC